MNNIPWNDILLRYFFTANTHDEPISRIIIVGDLKDILRNSIQGYPKAEAFSKCSPETLERCFLSNLNNKSFKEDRFEKKKNQFPYYMPELLVSLLAASITEETAEEGDFRNRLLQITNLKNLSNQLQAINIYWQKLQAYLLSVNIRLNLPDGGNQTQIGTTKKLAFPMHNDCKKLLKFLNESNHSETEKENFLSYINSGDIPLTLFKEIINNINYGRDFREECRKKSSIFIETLQKISLFEYNYTTKPISINKDIYYEYNSDEKRDMLIINIGNKNVVYDMGNLLSSSKLNDLPCQISKQKAEGLILFVEEGGLYRGKQYAPSSGQVILLGKDDVIFDSGLFDYDKYKIRKISECWYIIYIPDVAEIKKAMDDYGIDIHFPSSIFTFWNINRANVDGIKLVANKSYLLTSHFLPAISLKRTHNNLHVIAKNSAKYFSLNGTLIFDNEADCTTYQLPQELVKNVMQKVQNCELEIRDDQKQRVADFRVYTTIPKEDLCVGYKTLGQENNKYLQENEYGELINVGNKRVERAGTTPRSQIFYPSLFSHDKPITQPRIEYIGDPTGITDYRENELYEVLAARSLKKKGWRHNELEGIIGKIYGISPFLCELGIYSLIANGVLECFFDNYYGFRRYVAKRPQAILIGTSAGEYIWKICGLLAYEHRSLLQQTFTNEKFECKIPFYNTKSMKLFAPSGMITVKTKSDDFFSNLTSDLFEKPIDLPDRPIVTPIDELMNKHWNDNISESDLFQYEKEYWDAESCSLRKTQPPYNSVQLIRISKTDYYVRNLKYYQYVIRTATGKIKAIKSREWAIAAYAILSGRQIYKLSKKNVYCSPNVLLPIYFARYANLVGGYSFPFNLNGTIEYCYNSFADIFKCLENPTQLQETYKRNNDSMLPRIVEGHYSSIDLLKYRRRY